MLKTPSPNSHWRDSARYPRFFFVDARAVFPVFFCLLHIKLWTILLAVSVTAFFTVLNYYGFSVAVFGRWLRCTLAGRRKVAIPWWV
ncbi:MAG TPA: IcmT/TraK family protein [Gammaproteobacteria bacterium]|nr:IcmT/TraK family protein [Gammaproteobacteria bacterium]